MFSRLFTCLTAVALIAAVGCSEADDGAPVADSTTASTGNSKEQHRKMIADMLASSEQKRQELVAQRDELAAEFIQAIKADPGNADAYVERAIISAELSMFEDAKSDLDQAIKLQPEHPEALFRRGILLGDYGDYGPAIRDLTKVIELQPERAEAYFHRANIYTEQCIGDKAEADYAKAKSLGFVEPEPPADDDDAEAEAEKPAAE